MPVYPTRRSVARLLGAGGTLLPASIALSGCGISSIFGSDPPPKTRAEVSVQAAPTLNPDLNGRPSPVVARFYQLVTTELFENADFFQLFEQEKATLGPTSVGKEEVVLEPGQVTKVKFGIKPDVTALGVVVAFRAYDKATWRAMAKVAQDAINVYKLDVTSSVVSLTAGQPT